VTQQGGVDALATIEPDVLKLRQVLNRESSHLRRVGYVPLILFGNSLT
jgi:hypothetical protein